MTDEPMPAERAVRLLRAKAAELESELAMSEERPDRLAYLAADIALVATLLADHIRQCSDVGP